MHIIETLCVIMEFLQLVLSSCCLQMKTHPDTLDCRQFPLGWIEDLVLTVSKYLICDLSVEEAGKALQLLDETHVLDSLTQGPTG